MSELKACPFCGSKNIAIRDGRYSRQAEGSHYCTAICLNCYAKISGKTYNGYVEEDLAEQSAIEAWNRRVECKN